MEFGFEEAEDIEKEKASSLHSESLNLQENSNYINNSHSNDKLG